MNPHTYCEVQELILRDPFGISRGTRRSVQNLFVTVGKGLGEGAPIYYHNQTPGEMLSLAQEWCDPLPDLDRPIEEVVEELLQRYPGQTGLAEAIDLALHDVWGKTQKQPLYRLWGLEWKDVPLSSFTIGLDTKDVVLQKVEHAEEYPILKVKAGKPDDLEILKAIYEASGKPMFVDANEAWTVEHTLETLPRLADLNVQLLEQPLPRENRSGYAYLRNNNPTRIPIIVDEGVQGPADVLGWAGLADGINIKLAKCGGLARARRMIDIARQNGLKIMLGCMIESSLGITAAAHLAPLVDYLDLDGAALLADDPYDGMRLDRGALIMPDRPGIGVVSE